MSDWLPVLVEIVAFVAFMVWMRKERREVEALRDRAMKCVDEAWKHEMEAIRMNHETVEHIAKRVNDNPPPNNPVGWSSDSGGDMKLEPCPFCGGEANIGTRTFSPETARRTFLTKQVKFYFVSCAVCTARTDTLRGARTRVAAAKRWNARFK